VTRPLTVVTGGTRGIGAATARRLTADGHDLVLSYATDRAAAEATAAGLRDAGAACELVRADVADPEQVDLLFDRAAALGQVTGLVNNAGVTLHVGDLADTPVEVVRRVVEVNLLGAILVARRAVRDMVAGGSVVNVSSAAATLGSAHEYVHYAAAKAGVDALTMGLAQEVAPRGIRVNGVAPGIVRTGIHAAAGDADRLERVGSRVPLGRAGEPTEVAAAVAWLLGDDCPYATGATLRVAGGR
jgi:NAD(P)-dependent dehydrogenase (short-subunit alcohol dehydrogenase family)